MRMEVYCNPGINLLKLSCSLISIVKEDDFMQNKPIIGVMPLWDGERKSVWIHSGYIDGVIRAGGAPVLLPLTEDEEAFCRALEVCGGLLITGGQDVSPGLYGETAKSEKIDTCPLRDKLETAAIKIALERDMALLGICRGLQFLNVSLGGTLYQDILSEADSALVHLHTPPEDPVTHDVIIEPDTPLASVIQEQKIHVNSFHHQGVKKLSSKLKCMACATDGVLEAAYMPGKRFVRGVQWHPEMSYQTDGNSLKIFGAFVSGAKKDK